MKKLSRHLCFVVVFFAVMAALCTVSFAATVGQQLKSPESGWQRIDDNDNKITYSGSGWHVGNATVAGMYNNSMHYCSNLGSTISFNFIGTKLRIIQFTNPSHNQNVNINIDGTIYTYTERGYEDLVQSLVFEKTGLSAGVHNVSIKITSGAGAWFGIDAIDIDDTGYLVDPNAPSNPTSLNALSRDSKVDLTWTATATSGSSIYYNIKRSTTEGGPYSTIATTSAITYEDSSVISGLTYYYVVSAVVNGAESPNSNEASVIIKIPEISLEVTSVDKARVGDEITANIVIHNAINICAEDIKIYYDTSRLTYLGTENVEGIKIFKEDNTTGGAIRYITASLGKVNAANGDKVLIKLKFKAIAKGEALIDITNGRIADNATLEMDVTEENCGEKTVLIEGPRDVNRSGEYTLLDLGIDAWYYGFVAADTDMSKYDADQVEDGIIDDSDLTEIVNQMLKNPNYPAPTSHNL